MAFWCLCGVGAIVLAGAAVPLAVNSSQTSAQLALEVFVVVQIASLAMLFPRLSPRSLIALAAATVPLALLAGFIAATPVYRVAVCSGYLLSLAFLLAMVGGSGDFPGRSQPLKAVLGLVLLGLPLLKYWGEEIFTDFSSPLLSAMSPIDTALALARGRPLPLLHSLLPAIFGGLILLARHALTGRK